MESQKDIIFDIQRLQIFSTYGVLVEKIICTTCQVKYYLILLYLFAISVSFDRVMSGLKQNCLSYYKLFKYKISQRQALYKILILEITALYEYISIGHV